MLFVLAAGTAQAAVDNAGNVVQQEAAEQLAAAPITNMVIPYGSFSGTVIDFDGLAGSSVLGSGEILGAQFASSGVTFDVPNFDAYASTGLLASTSANSDPNVIWVDQGGGGGGASAVGMNINFAPAVSEVGLLAITSLNSTATLAIYDGATLLETLTVTLPASPDGFGLEGFLALSNTNITRAVISSADSSGQNWNFVIDDLKFASITEVAIDIKFCSDPNAFNCKKKGVLPVTIFGTESFDVADIDVSTLRLCRDDTGDCTGPPTDWSFDDRGDPTTDLGASQCALVDTDGDEVPDTELHTLNPDGWGDLDVGFDAGEVQVMLGEFCGGPKNGVSATLFIEGETFDGTPIESIPVGNTGTDQLVKKNR
jgi:hypothetical protein